MPPLTGDRAARAHAAATESRRQRRAGRWHDRAALGRLPNEDLELVKLLLAAGANVKAATRDGAITPLFMACTNGNAAIVEALLKAGASANSVNGQWHHRADDRRRFRQRRRGESRCWITAPKSRPRNRRTSRRR